MRQNLLEITQHILSAMDSDEVNSITDTVESYQVALLLKQVYYDIASDIRLPTQETLFKLEASGDVAKPCLMTVPTTVMKVDWVKYNNYLPVTQGDTDPNFKEVEKVALQDFVAWSNGLVDQGSIVGTQTITMDADSFTFMYYNDRMPTKYCDIGNNTLIFDAYLATEDSTLQKTKTMCMGTMYPTFDLDDTYIPDLDPTQFSYYINKAKARAFFELKQQKNDEAVGEARRQKIITQVRKERTESTPALFKHVRYGRK